MTDLDNLSRLLAVMARLRDPARGCPWTASRISPRSRLIRSRKPMRSPRRSRRTTSAALRDELGDLLFQVVFHARMAEEAGLFDFDESPRRSPTRWCGGTLMSSAAPRSPPPRAERGLEEHKEAERRAKAATGVPVSALDGVGLALPALTRAAKIQAARGAVRLRLADAAPVFDKIAEEIAELKAELAVRRRHRASRGGSRRSALRRRQPRTPSQDRSRTGSSQEQHRNSRTLPSGRGTPPQTAGKAPGEATLDEMEADGTAKAEGL